MSFDDIQQNERFANSGGPTWRSPNHFYVVEAESFGSPEHEANGGIPGLDRAVGLRLLKFPYNDFWAYHRWYAPLQDHILFETAPLKAELETLTSEREALLAEYAKIKAAGGQTRETTIKGKAVRARMDAIELALAQPYTVAPLMSPEDTVPGMTAAAEDLAGSIDKGETIAVWCDYDVDGTTAGEALRRALAPYEAKLIYGWADAKAGFGVSTTFIKEAADQGATVLITLDCGSGSNAEIALARSLGMKTIVVDHHASEDMNENEADHHLNPNRFELATSAHTGAQLAWKFGAAVQIAKEGAVREEHWQEPLYLAAMGCYADMGSVNLHENRAFFWLANEHCPIGVQELAKEMGEDHTLPGQMVTTQACLNLAKRSPSVATSDVGALLAATTAEEARPYIDKLLGQYRGAAIARKEMVEIAIAQTGRPRKELPPLKEELETLEKQAAQLAGDASAKSAGVLAAKRAELAALEALAATPYAVAVIEDPQFGDYLGYTGPIANTLSRETGKPAIVFVRNGEDVKFSMRNESKVPVQLGGLIDYEPMKEACIVPGVDEDGNATESTNLGGHAAVVSGRCKPENIKQVVAAIEAWADHQNGWFPTEERGPGAPFVQEKLVDPARLATIEEQAKKLGPFSSMAMPVWFKPEQENVEKTWNGEVQVGVAGTLEVGDVDPENEKWLVAKLRFANGDFREARFPVDEELPEGPMQWLLRCGRPGTYYLRKSTPLPVVAEAA